MYILKHNVYQQHTQNTQENDVWSFLQCPKYFFNDNKLYSSAAHCEQHLKYSTSRTCILNYMRIKVVKRINHIGTMKTFTKPNYSLCMEEPLTIPKRLHGKHITLMIKKIGIYGTFWHKTTFIFFNAIIIPLLDEKVGPYNVFKSF